MLAAAFLVSVSTLAISVAPLRVDLVFEGMRIHPKMEAAVTAEVAAIWKPYGVDVQAVALDDPGRDGAVRLDVVLSERPDRRMPYNALGSIAFIADSPQRVIVMYPRAVADLISQTAVQGRSEAEWPRLFRDAVFGRVLGRALAHELGHYLLRSRDHAIAGLMRAAQPGLDLVSIDRQTFALTPTEAARLAGTVAVSAP
jgi:hypothetical protein